MKRLEEICIFIRNGLNIKNDKSKKGIPITRIETISNGIIDINKTGYANIFNDKYIDYYLRQDDILMSHINSLKHLGKVGYCYYDMKIIHGMNLLNIRVNPNNVYPKYLYYYFKSNNFKIKLNKISKQSVNQSSFSISDLKKIRIDIIDLKKQKLIVSKLDKVVEVISIRKKQIEELNNLIKSQFVEMFDLEKYKSEELGKICDVRDGTHDSPKYIEKSDYKLITSKNINKEGIDFSDVKYITKKDYDKINIRSNVSYGDILMPMIGTIGNPVIVKVQEEKIDFTIKNLALIKFFIKTVVINKYIKYLVDSEWFEKEVLKNSRGGTQKFLSLKDIRKMKIPLSPIDLQNQFSEIVKQIDKQKFESMIQLKMMEKIYNIINDRRRYV